MDFTCALANEGTVAVRIQVANPILPVMEPFVRCWALRLENPTLSEGLYRGLNLELEPFKAFAAEISLNLPVGKKEERQPTLADHHVSILKDKTEAATAIAKMSGREYDITGDVQGYVSRTIPQIFNAPRPSNTLHMP